MALISGVGDKKLATYGRAFLEVILGAPPRIHPTRARLAGTDAGALFDRLMDLDRDLRRGESGTDKPLSCTHTTLRLIAERRPATLADLGRLQGMGPDKVTRFGTAFLQAIRDG
jgi:ATP-dependent DNA helicase RecQ